MREPGYRIEPDPRRRFLRLTLYGFWDEATLDRYKTDLRKLAAGAAKAGISTDGFRVLIDLREHTLLGREHAMSLGGLLDDLASNDRTAILIAQAGLLKKQVERIASVLRPSLFTSEAEALAWLFEE